MASATINTHKIKDSLLQEEVEEESINYHALTRVPSGRTKSGGPSSSSDVETGSGKVTAMHVS